MRSHLQKDMTKSLKIKDITVIAVSSVILVVSKEVLKFLPGIELVSLLVLLYTKAFKNKTIYIIYIFVLIEGLLYGFGLWWLMYLYVWTILFFAVKLFGDLDNALAWAIILAIYGLLFGTLCSVPYFLTLGVTGAVAWIVSGFVFDLFHCAGNFLVTLLLYKPLSFTLCKIIRSYVSSKD